MLIVDVGNLEEGSVQILWAQYTIIIYIGTITRY